MQSQAIETNTIKLHILIDGPENGSSVVLLHGFPEFHYGWRKQVPALVEAGFRVIVPDQRRYNLSDKPKDVSAYDVDILAKEILVCILLPNPAFCGMDLEQEQLPQPCADAGRLRAKKYIHDR